VNEVQIISCEGYNPKLHVLKSLLMIWDFKTHKVISCKFYMLMEGFIFVHDWCVSLIYDNFMLFDYVVETMIIVGTTMVVHNIEPLWKGKGLRTCQALEGPFPFIKTFWRKIHSPTLLAWIVAQALQTHAQVGSLELSMC
jgi:hypothetical protein